MSVGFGVALLPYSILLLSLTDDLVILYMPKSRDILSNKCSYLNSLVVAYGHSDLYRFEGVWLHIAWRGRVYRFLFFPSLSIPFSLYIINLPFRSLMGLPIVGLGLLKFSVLGIYYTTVPAIEARQLSEAT